MSRIFDALQRSGTEQSGIEYPDMLSVATEVFEATQDQITPEPAPSVPSAAWCEPERFRGLAEAPAPELPTVEVANELFPSLLPLQVTVAPTSRLVFFTEPHGLAAEKFRFLGFRLRQLQQSRPLKKVLITSTIPQEGKSTVAANLACALASRTQQRTLLLDGDLRRPTLAKQFGLGKILGISEWLQGEGGPTTSIYQLEDTRLWILPAGSTPKDPLELMQSGRLSTIVRQLTTWFDWIVIDSPPVLPLADTSIWMRQADGFLLVARQGVTGRDLLRRGLEAMEQSKLLGTVLNASTKTAQSDYYYQAVMKS